MKAYDDQSKSSENIRHGTISSFCTAVFVKEDRESGAEAVFVYATKSQRTTRQLQRLRVCRAIDKVAHSCDEIARVTSVLCTFLLALFYCIARPMQAPWLNVSLIRFFFISALYILFACLYPHLSLGLSFFLHFFLTYLLPYLSLPLRIDPLRFHAGCRKRRFNLALVFSCLFCVKE